MNTANLQLEGFHLALAAIVRLLRDKGVLVTSEIEAMLVAVENGLVPERAAPGNVSEANIDATCFPLRFQRAALHAGASLSFNTVAAEVHRIKPAHAPGREREGGRF